MRYAAELQTLGHVQRQVSEVDVSALQAAIAPCLEGDATFVGSGGTLAVAQLAADLHRAKTGHLAIATTPLDFASTDERPEVSVILLSASGKHPDVRAAAAIARRRGNRNVALFTLRDRASLPRELVRDVPSICTVDVSGVGTGFLATGSVLALSCALVRAYGHKLLPTEPAPSPSRVLRSRTLVLYEPLYRCVAIDLETRLHELGLSAVQVVDFRNFAHGRHTGLARNMDETSVIAIYGPEEPSVAEPTLARLPANTDLVELRTQNPWPIGAIELLVASMRLVEATAEHQKVEPSRPGAPEFGRKLYHAADLAGWSPQRDPVHRKLLALPGPVPSVLRARYGAELDTWLKRAAQARFVAVVLDYDGTVCATGRRFELPDEEIRRGLLRLLRYISIGFASGRGKSLHRSLREWVPSHLWGRVHVGMYNGAVMLTLADEIPPQVGRTEPLMELMRRVEGSALDGWVCLEERTHQVSFSLEIASGIGLKTLTQLVYELINRSPALPLKVSASGHSVDVVCGDTSKANLLGRLGSPHGEILAIGDQGQAGGNDFELLSAVWSSLSVDRCSGDPTRCWNLDDDGVSGPALLLRYLEALRVGKEGASLCWGSA